MARCDRCNKVLTPEREHMHICPPEIWVWVEEFPAEDTRETIFASSLQAAAEQFVDAYDACCFDSGHVSENLVVVAQFVDSGIAARFTVTGEWQPVYVASQIKEGR